MGVDSTLGQVLRLTLRVPGPWAPDATGWTGIGAWVMAFCSRFWPRAGSCTGLLVRNAPMV